MEAEGFAEWCNEAKVSGQFQKGLNYLSMIFLKWQLFRSTDNLYRQTASENLFSFNRIFLSLDRGAQGGMQFNE